MAICVGIPIKSTQIFQTMPFSKPLPSDFPEYLEKLRKDPPTASDLTNEEKIKAYELIEEAIWKRVGHEVLVSFKVDDSPFVMFSWDTINTNDESVVSIRLYSGSEKARRVEMYRYLSSPLRLRLRYVQVYSEYLLALCCLIRDRINSENTNNDQI